MGDIRKILALDVSTHAVGVTLASWDGENEPMIHEVTHWRPKIPTKLKGTEALFMKSKIIAENIARYKEVGITDVVIEEPLIGSNNANTAATLLRFNGMISQSVYTILGVVPAYISSHDARKYGCPTLMAIRKFNKAGNVYEMKKLKKAMKDSDFVLFGAYPFDCEKKYILWNMMAEKYPKIEWVYDKNGDLKKENFDASDSLVTVLGYIGMIRYGGTEPVMEKYEEKDNSLVYSYTFCGQKFEKSIILT